MNEGMQPQNKYNFFAPGNQPVFFIIFWFVLNIIQVSFNELTSDEGYYWFYSQHLQWGYYDHPPFIALMIKAGAAIFPGELGVRFFNVVLSTAGLYLFFRLLPVELKQARKTFIVLLSAPLLHYLTFIVFPDGPLLFFSLLFLFVYKKFLAKKNFTTSFLLGLSLALMAYSKYHGALVLLFTVLANPRLFKSLYFYLALLIAALLFAPHLWWQYQNDFPTIMYHLSGRTGTISFKHVGEYISQQIFAIGPALIFLPFVVKTKDVFERTLKFIIFGAFLFFLISSFKTFVHFHWTSIALYPLLYFAVIYYNNPQKKKLYKSLVLPFVFLFFIARILLLFPIIPNMHVGEDYYHGREKWAKEIAAISGSKPVFTPNNLREISLYSFYSGKTGITLYNRPEKKSQYELWGYEDSLQGKNVLFLAKYPFITSMPLANSLKQNFNFAFLDSFSSYYTGIEIKSKVVQQTIDSIIVEIGITNERKDLLVFNRFQNNPSLVFLIEKQKQVVKDGVIPILSSSAIRPFNSSAFKTSIAINDLPPNDYVLYFGIRNGILPDAVLSAPIEFRK
jgi:hypothetical protein